MMPAGPADAQPASSIAGIKILIVEDEPFIAFDLMMAIQDAGAIALGPAATVAEAIDFLHNENPAAAIVDVHLPDGTIGAFLDEAPKELSIVIHTGVGLPPDVRARHPHVPTYAKPTDPAILIKRLAEGLRRA
ncbi:MAG: hypothetical protein B7Z38_01555 [Rhodobacterales bacterium 12-64-8]|nr:MAG: hypothetical protein B7Z38_01555 [Rhodobacterales bacterium 12-64-8]OYX50319.1 MAG: hypothetical protein B7Y90_04920 [Alphaproteobacteria bacterium 32-64-14]